SSAAQIINISNFIHAQRLNYPYFKKGLDRIRHTIEQEIIQPAPIYLIGNLSPETIEKGHLMLKNNQTQGNKLIIQNQ
ncbi:hypothetical protein, partial [Sphingobacterium multivorum]